MSWYSSSWSYRIPILVDNLVASTSPIDVIATIPADLDEFWTNVKTNGEDVRVTDADGVTLLTFDLADASGAGAFSKANRDGRVEIDNFTPPAQTCMAVVWLYWGNSAASTALSTFAPAAPRNGYMTALRPSGQVLNWKRPQPGKYRPSGGGLAMTTDEHLQPWVIVTHELQVLQTQYNGHFYSEELEYIKETVEQAGSDVGAAHDNTQIRMAGRGAIRAHIQSGAGVADDSEAVLSLVIGTTTGKTFNPRILVKVRDVSE